MAKLKIALGRDLNDAGYAPGIVLLSGQAEDPSALFRSVETLTGMDVIHSDKGDVAMINVSDKAAEARANLEDALSAQSDDGPVGNRYGHPTPLSGHFVDRVSPVLLVGPGHVKDSRKTRSVMAALDRGIPTMAIEDGHFGMTKAPGLWVAASLAARGGCVDSTCIRSPYTMSFVAAADADADLYDAGTGEFMDLRPHECANTFLYSSDDAAFAEDYLEDFTGLSGFGTGSSEILAITLAVWLGFREVITVGFPAEAYDGMLSLLGTRMHTRGTWLTNLDGADVHGSCRLSNKDFLAYVDHYALRRADVSRLKEVYMRSPKDGGRILKHRHLLEKYDKLVRIFDNFDTPLIRAEVTEAREIMKRDKGCRDCELKQSLALLMDRFHQNRMSCDDPAEFDAKWREAFPDQNYYVRGGNRYARGPETGNPV